MTDYLDLWKRRIINEGIEGESETESETGQSETESGELFWGFNKAFLLEKLRDDIKNGKISGSIRLTYDEHEEYCEIYGLSQSYEDYILDCILQDIHKKIEEDEDEKLNPFPLSDPYPQEHKIDCECKAGEELEEVTRC